ncbi:MAG: molybdate transport system permease protein [Elusimicrobia bacterium]|nr:MAG: molybdate transport system permease protein [Elusimicrobiota bacterium]
MEEFWGPLLLSARLAAVTTAVLLVLGLPLAYWLAYSRGRLRHVAHAAVSLPLVLPPTVLGFYLLLLLGPRGPAGRLCDALGGPALVFSFTGLVIGSVLFSLPFMVHPVEAALAALPPSLSEAAAVLGKGRWETFRRVLLPNIRPAVLGGAVMTFAHTLGEFGVVLMLGGGIPGQTRTASVAVYSEVESLSYGLAHRHALALLLLTFPVLLGLRLLRAAPPGGRP